MSTTSADDTRARLVDYFVEVVADVVSPPPRKRHAADVDEFERRIAFRLPATDHADFPLPDGVPFFCIPSCLSTSSPSTFERKPTFFSFSLTGGDGSRAYGFAIHFYDAIEGGDDAWRPRVFCIISHHPFFSLFKEIVSWVFRQRTHSSEQRVVESILADASGQRSWFVSPRRSSLSSGADVRPYRPPPIDTVLARATSDTGGAGANPEEPQDFSVDDAVDRVLMQLVLHAECPTAGGAFHLRVDGRDFFKYHVHRSNVGHVDDYCFQVLFQCLSLKNVVYVINCMLLEQRVLIHSNHHGLLTPVCEALCALLFPFTWEHVYVPFLPVKLIEYLQAPVPYIMGLHTSSLATKIGADIFSSCVVIHLDKDKVVTPISSRIDDSPVDFVLARLPSREVDALLRTVEPLVPQPVNASSGGMIPPTRFANNNNNNHNSPLQRQPSSPLAHVVESLSFTNAGSPIENELELTFGEGPLGITFESTHLRLLAVNHFQPGRQRGTSAVVKTLPRLQNGLPGPAERSGLIRAGSFLVAINGVSTLDLTFEETIDRLRVEKRPVRLRFLNAPAPHMSACRFAERLQSLSLVSALQIDHSNTLLRWVDAVRGAFAVMFTSIFRDFQRFILIEHIGPPATPSPSASSKRTPRLTRSSSSSYSNSTLQRRRSSVLAFSVTFDHASFCEAASEATCVTQTPGGHSPIGFLREFTQTQTFAGFVNDSVMGRISHTTTFPQLELFHNCVHLYHEMGDADAATAAIPLLFERDHTVIETLELELPLHQPADDPTPGETLLSAAPSLSQSTSTIHSSVRSPVKSPLSAGLSASPAKRTSTTRQLEMKICGSLIETNDDDSSGGEVATLDSELLQHLDDVVPEASAKTSGLSSSPCRSLSSSTSVCTLTVGRRSESLSSMGSVNSSLAVEDESFNENVMQKTSTAGTKLCQLQPEDAMDDPLVLSQSVRA